MADDSNRPWRDMGYVLLIPIVLMVLLSFRRGWVLSILFSTLLVLPSMDNGVAIASTLAGGQSQPTPHTVSIEESADGELETDFSKRFSNFYQRLSQSFLDLWFTRDQQARWFFEQGQFRKAASFFEDPMWRGIAFYYAEEFTAAERSFALLDSKLARFNRANSLAQGQFYVAALAHYDALLIDFADFDAAEKNAARLRALIAEINQMSASQRAEAGVATRELGEGPQRADGAEQEDISSEQVEQLTADQLLSNEQIHEMWMRQVQADPSRFLRAKFIIQQTRRQEASEQ